MLQGATMEFGQQITSLTSTNESSVILVKVAPGGTAGRLMHPVPIACYLLEGTVIEVRESGGQMVHHAGTAHFDPINTCLHRVGALPAPGAPSRGPFRGPIGGGTIGCSRGLLNVRVSGL